MTFSDPGFFRLRSSQVADKKTWKDREILASAEKSVDQPAASFSPAERSISLRSADNKPNSKWLRGRCQH